jgi:hypothetical protein
MNSSFEEVWSDIRRRLRVDTIIRNWSVHGYTGKTFRIVGVDNTAVMVSSGRMQDKGKGRLVSRGEFERFFPLWPAYKAGTVQRTALFARLPALLLGPALEMPGLARQVVQNHVRL